MPELSSLTPANTASRTPAILVGASATFKIAQQAVQSVPIAREIIGIIAHIVDLADKVDKNNEALRGLADKAAAFARDVDDATSHARTIGESMTQRLERLRKLFRDIEALMSREVNTSKSARKLLRGLFTLPTVVARLSGELDVAVQGFQLAAAIETRLYVEEMSPHDGQFMQLLDCQVKKVDVIMKQETEHGTVVYLKARVDGVNELMVVRVCVNCPAIADRSRDDCDSNIVDLIATVSNLTTSHPNVAQLYGRSIRRAATRFMAIRSGVHNAKDYLISGYTDDVVRYSSLLSMLFLVMSASAHLEDLGIIWIPESSDALVVDDHGQPTIGAFGDLVSIELLPRQRQVLAVTSFYTAVRRLMVPGHEHSEEVGNVDDCHGGTLKACVDAARAISLQVDTIWEMLREKELRIQIWREALPIVDLSDMSPSMFLQGESYWRKLVQRSSWSQYIRRPGAAYPRGADGNTMQPDELKGRFECFYLRHVTWRGHRVSHGLQMRLTYGTETVVLIDFLINISDDIQLVSSIRSLLDLSPESSEPDAVIIDLEEASSDTTMDVPLLPLVFEFRSAVEKTASVNGHPDGSNGGRSVHPRAYSSA